MLKSKDGRNGEEPEDSKPPEMRDLTITRCIYGLSYHTIPLRAHNFMCQLNRKNYNKKKNPLYKSLHKNAILRGRHSSL
jgi:hypothetical protein